MYFCVFQFPFHKKKNKTEGINKSNIIYYQNDDSDHSDNYQIWEEGYLLVALNTSVYLNYKLLQNWLTKLLPSQKKLFTLILHCRVKQMESAFKTVLITSNLALIILPTSFSHNL